MLQAPIFCPFDTGGSKAIRLTVCDVEGDVRVIEVDENETVETVKVILEAEFAVPYKLQLLFFETKQLENNQRLSAAGVKHDDMLMMQAVRAAPARHGAAASAAAQAPSAHAGGGSAGAVPEPGAAAPKRNVVVQNKGELPSYTDLLVRKALTVGDRVFCSQRKGKRFYGDLLQDGRIRYSSGQTPALDLFFPSPTAFNNFCGQMADPSYEKGNGFVYTFHKGNEEKVWMPLDYYRWSTFGRSQYIYPQNFTRGENAVSSLASLGKNTLPFGFTEDDEETGVSQGEHFTDAEHKRVESLCAAVNNKKIYGKKLSAMDPQRKRKATGHGLVDKAAKRRIRIAKKQLEAATSIDSIKSIKVVVHDRDAVREGEVAGGQGHAYYAYAPRPPPLLQASTVAGEDARARVNARRLEEIKVGDSVWAQWKGEGLFPGKIKNINGDQTFAVEYDDGDFDPSVARAQLKFAFEYPQQGDEVELLFSKKPRIWVKGVILSADIALQSFNVYMEIQESEEYVAQTIYNTYHFSELGRDWRWVGDKEEEAPKSSSKPIKSAKRVKSKDKSVRSSAQSVKSKSTAKQIRSFPTVSTSSPVSATSSSHQPIQAVDQIQQTHVPMAPEEEAEYRAMKQRIRSLEALLASKNVALSKLAYLKEAYEDCRTFQEHIQTLASERVALLEADGSRQCVCCWDRVSTVALRPCGHVCVCDECSGNTQSCPLCRTKVSAIMRIFFSDHRTLLPSLPCNFLRTERRPSRRFGASDGGGGEGEGGGGGSAGSVSVSEGASEGFMALSAAAGLLVNSPGAAAALLEKLKQEVASAEQKRVEFDASLPCGQCDKLFSACTHSHASSHKALSEQRDALLKQRNSLQHEKSALLEWASAQTRSCVVCSEQVSKSHDVSMQGEGSKKRTEASTVALVPCGHVCLCEACAHTQTLCPWCAVKVSCSMRIYLS